MIPVMWSICLQRIKVTEILNCSGPHYRSLWSPYYGEVQEIHERLTKFNTEQLAVFHSCGDLESSFI